MLRVDELRLRALGPISFALDPADCLTLTGLSGSGKSTLLRAIADLELSSGSITLDGVARETIDAREWRRKVGYVPAETGWWADSVAPHFEEWIATLSLVRALGLSEDCGSWPISRLSTGERQRLGLARALAREPRVLLLDEPTSALDEIATMAVERQIGHFLADGNCAIWVTHDAKQAARVATRTAVLVDGRMLVGALTETHGGEAS